MSIPPALQPSVPPGPGDQSGHPRVGKEVSDGAESQSMGQGARMEEKERRQKREMLAAQRKSFCFLDYNRI